MQKMYLFFNPSQGLFADLGESLREVMGLNSGISRQLAGLLENSLMGGASVSVVGHSQGALILQGALTQLGDNGFDFAGRLSVSAFGPAANRASFQDAAFRVGAPVSGFLVNRADFVATVIGRNAPGLGSVLYSTASFPMLFGYGSPHSSCAYFGGC